ncbi:MAG: hypothetical protein GY716_01985 [bacterium]|nr:hypothetical protein [bacterium]
MTSRSRSVVLRLVMVLACALALGFVAEAREPGAVPAAGETAEGRWIAPPVDVPRLLQEDAANDERNGIPLRIGYPMATDLHPKNAGTWETTADGDRLWRLKVSSAGARWTVLGFDRFRLQPGGELSIFDPQRKAVLGPFTADDVRDHGEFWTPPVAGDTLVLELLWPAKLGDESPQLHLSTVSHGYKAFGAIGRQDVPGADDPEALGASGSCNNDVACPLGDDWRDQIRGAVILLSGGSGFCSGSMINTTANDCRPYMLTADHCGAGVGTTIGFNYERSECSGGTTPPTTAQTLTGATVLAEFSSSDFSLLEMNDEPPESYGAYFSGWSAEAQAATEAWGIHHPSGDVKKISYNDDPLVDGQNWGPNHWRVTEWEDGTTEPGSSGSPIFDQNHRIVGQLHGGTASCSSITYDEYGKVAASWTGGGSSSSRLSDWLDPDATGALVMDGVDATTCAFNPAGEITLPRAIYSCSDSLQISVRDDSLQGQGSLDVTVQSSTETAPETVTLSAIEPGSGTFAGPIAVGGGPTANGDGTITVAHGDTITVEYFDADDGAGGSGTVQSVASVDCVPPIIANVTAIDVTGSAATIEWDTDEAADSVVTYGLTPQGPFTEVDGALVTAHSLRLFGLQECSVHYFEVASADVVGNGAADDNGGLSFSFETGKNTESDFPAGDTPVAIPDNSTVSSTISVADDLIVTDVDVQVNISHTYDGDLQIRLVAPNGTQIMLSDRHGGSGENYTNTVFDDEAATSIASGAPPFTGEFQPDQPLSAADGISALGDWRLEVVDNAGADTGSIVSWTLGLTFPTGACGPSASYRSHALVADTCGTGGAGDANGFWEAGEQVQFSVTVDNDGNELLTGLTARVVPTTPGVVMLDDVADFADLAAGEAGVSLAPHVTALLPAGLPCGSEVEFDVEIDAGQGTWQRAFVQGAGDVVPGNGVVLDEDFEGGALPATWTVVDGLADGNTWYADSAADPLGCANTDPNTPLSGTWAAVDSDCTGGGVAMDEELMTPMLDLSMASTVTLELDHWFRNYQTETADIDVRSSLTGGQWVNVARWNSVSTSNPQHEALDLTAHAAGASDVEVRWHYYDADYEWTWFVDNVRVTFTAPGECNMETCSASGSAPPPIPDGSGGSLPLTVGKPELDGSRLDLSWDDQCSPTEAQVLYGPLGQVSTMSVAGAACAVLTPHDWDPAPAGDIWFVVVSGDGNGTEGSWGLSSSGAERNGASASGECGASVKDVSGVCP